MAKNVLPVDFQDDILSEDMNGRRKYQMITNADGTVSFVDVTEYTQVGSNFGQAQINATNAAVNESADKNKIIDDKDDLVANSQAGMIAGALAVKAIRDELNNNREMKQRGGTNLNVVYNDSVVFITLLGSNVSINNHEVSTEFALPDGVLPNADRYIIAPLMDSGWRPTNKIAYFNFKVATKNPIIRLSTDTTSVSYAVIVGTYAFPRNYFSIT